MTMQPPLDVHAPERPLIVCLCGSTRFSEAYQKANLEETLGGKIVLTIGCDMGADSALFDGLPETELNAVKWRLDQLHMRKIELADEILVLNVGGYIGKSTANEIAHARQCGKVVRFLEEDKPAEAAAAARVSLTRQSARLEAEQRRYDAAYLAWEELQLKALGAFPVGALVSFERGGLARILTAWVGPEGYPLYSALDASKDGKGAVSQFAGNGGVSLVPEPEKAEPLPDGRMRGAVRLIDPLPPRDYYTCGGLVYRFGKADKPRQCHEFANVKRGGTPSGWVKHKDFGPLCPKCAEVDGKPRMLPSQ